MHLSEWAKKEIELASTKEDGYGKAVMNSAAKAFMSLIDDEHSGMSIGFTKNILNRLIDCKPLTPLTGEDSEWVLDTLFYDENCNPKVSQNARCSSVFKRDYDGVIEYDDIDRFVCEDISGSRFYSNTIPKIVMDSYPDIFPKITMPYMPSDKPAVIRVEDFLVDPSHGDFDTQGILYVTMPDNTVVYLNIFTTEDADGNMKVISIDEYKILRGKRITQELEHSDVSVPFSEVKDTGEISDGYHTFNELYYHRMMLFSIICNTYKSVAWKSWKHDDDTMYDDMFIVGVSLPYGDYSYHYNKEHWDRFDVTILDRAPKWDGHKPEDITRLEVLVK